MLTVTLTHTAAGAEYDDVTASLAVTVDDDETAAIVLSQSALSTSAEGVHLGRELHRQALARADRHRHRDGERPRRQRRLTRQDVADLHPRRTGTARRRLTVKAAEDADVEVTIVENDAPSVVLSSSALSVGEGDTTGKSYTVKLATQPSASVTVTVSGHASSDVSVSGTSLTNNTLDLHHVELEHAPRPSP